MKQKVNKGVKFECLQLNFSDEKAKLSPTNNIRYSIIAKIILLLPRICEITH